MTTEIDGIDLDALNYTTLIPYNGTEKQGANPLDYDVNLWYQVCACARTNFSLPLSPHFRPATQAKSCARSARSHVAQC